MINTKEAREERGQELLVTVPPPISSRRPCLRSWTWDWRDDLVA